MTTYVVATTEQPAVVCPPWCVVPEEDHVAELSDWEGFAVHQSGWMNLPNGLGTYGFGGCAYLDGAPDPTDPFRAELHIGPEDRLGPAELRDLAAALVLLADNLEVHA